MEIEARHLRLVKTVADVGSISAAASALGTTQPALTRQLRRIERGLGGELFLRSREGVEQTSLGRLVVGRADAVLSVIDSLQADVAAAAAASVPANIRIGVRGGQILLGLMHGLREILPDAEIITDSESRLGGLLDLIGTGRLDLAVIHEFVGYEIRLDPRVTSTEIECEPVFLLLSESHPMADRDELELADLAGENWLLSPLDVDREADCMTGACAEVGFAPKIVHYLGDTLGFELIRAGEAIAPCLPNVQYAGTVLKPIAGSPIRVRHILLAERHNPLQDHRDKLAAFVCDTLSAARESQPVYNAWLERHAG